MPDEIHYPQTRIVKSGPEGAFASVLQEWMDLGFAIQHVMIHPWKTDDHAWYSAIMSKPDGTDPSQMQIYEARAIRTGPEDRFQEDLQKELDEGWTLKFVLIQPWQTDNHTWYTAVLLRPKE